MFKSLSASSSAFCMSSAGLTETCSGGVFHGGKKKYMHKNFSNQLERDTALDSPADVEAALTRQRRICLQHKNEEKTRVRARGIAERRRRSGELRRHGERVTVLTAPRSLASPVPLCQVALKSSLKPSSSSSAGPLPALDRDVHGAR